MIKDGLTEIYKNVMEGRNLNASHVVCTRKRKLRIKKTIRKRRRGGDGGQIKSKLFIYSITKNFPLHI
jgi:hypothetical protein